MRRLQNKKSQSLLEYVLITAVIIAVLLGFLTTLQEGVRQGLDDANSAMKNATAKLSDLLAD